MFLKRSCRLKKGEVYESWALAESVRTTRGPRQRTVATLGKLPGLDPGERAGWEHVSDILEGKTTPALDVTGYLVDKLARNVSG